MKLIFYKINPKDRGFSLLETAIALTTLGICLAYAMPLFLYAKINNSKSDIQTGALIVAQRVFDNVRSQSITNLPSNDGYASPLATNPVSKPIDVANPTPQEELLTKAMGRQYKTTITYCEGNSVTNPVCGAQYRQFRVQVSYNGTNVYDLQGTYTEFD
ncbi:type II secretion system protein [Chamaesiphon sp.]|uniref:type II secretion system protein n=1 Tax=Chamaesiphon sp. TaxID=2814140 RepID=UPI003592E9E9